MIDHNDAGRDDSPASRPVLAGEGPAARVATAAPAAVFADPLFANMDLDHPALAELHRLKINRDLAARAGAPAEAVEAPLLELIPEKDLFEPKKVRPEDLIRGGVRLATLPELHLRLLSELNSPRCSPTRVAEMMATDTGLSARLLKIANSPLYGFAGRVDSVKRAFDLIGINELRTLILGMGTMSAFQDIPPRLMDMRAFWRHSIACGVHAGLLGREVSGVSRERLFIGGLLHDIGQLVILKKMPAAAMRAMLLCKAELLPLSEAETAVFGFDHARVGEVLLEQWRFPEPLIRIVARHHAPSTSPDDREAAVVHIADIMAWIFPEPPRGIFALPAFRPTAWEALDLRPEMLAAVAEEAEAQIRDIESVLTTGRMQ